MHAALLSENLKQDLGVNRSIIKCEEFLVKINNYQFLNKTPLQ
jgi:hypothetical protein